MTTEDERLQREYEMHAQYTMQQQAENEEREHQYYCEMNNHYQFAIEEIKSTKRAYRYLENPSEEQTRLHEMLWVI